MKHKYRELESKNLFKLAGRCLIRKSNRIRAGSGARDTSSSRSCNMLQDWHLLASIQELPLVLQGCTARVQLLAACRKRWIARKLPRQVQDLWSKQVADIYTIYETKNVAFACATFSKVVSNCKKNGASTCASREERSAARSSRC